MLTGRSAGGRSTRQKQAIRDVFSQAEHPLAIDEIHAAAQVFSAGLSVPTVYRSVRALLDEGWLAAINLPGRNAVYETAARDHHHHFVCEHCECVFELHGCSSIDVRLPAGFVARDHDITITGTCAGCIPKKRPART